MDEARLDVSHWLNASSEVHLSCIMRGNEKGSVAYREEWEGGRVGRKRKA